MQNKNPNAFELFAYDSSSTKWTAQCKVLF